jgi:hypothetical protein
VRELRTRTDAQHAVETFRLSINRHIIEQSCKRKVEVSGFCKVEMSKLPFRQMTEAEIGSFQHEWTRTATHRSSF